MAHKVVLRAAAAADLTALYDYIASHSSPEIAIGYVRRIQEACLGLATFPKRGHRRDDILPGLRVVGFERRVSIAFRVLKTRVEIVSIAYGGRDFERELRKANKAAGRPVRPAAQRRRRKPRKTAPRAILAWPRQAQGQHASAANGGHLVKLVQPHPMAVVPAVGVGAREIDDQVKQPGREVRVFV